MRKDKLIYWTRNANKKQTLEREVDGDTNGS